MISLSILLFAILWGEFWIFCITAIAAMIFDGQFIVIQRFNRPRVVKNIEKMSKKGEICQKTCKIGTNSI